MKNLKLELNSQEAEIIYNALVRYKIHSAQMATKEQINETVDKITNRFWRDRVIEVTKLIEVIENK